jgi:hypothetical protein
MAKVILKSLYLIHLIGNTIIIIIIIIIISKIRIKSKSKVDLKNLFSKKIKIKLICRFPTIIVITRKNKMVTILKLK